MGGNAIKSSVRLLGENWAATIASIIDTFFKPLGLSDNTYAIIGSGGKKYDSETYGDIDIAIDANALVELNITKTTSTAYKTWAQYAKSVSPEVVLIQGFNIVSCRFPIASVNGKQAGDMVQVDFIITPSLAYTSFAYWSPFRDESRYRGVCRNQLLISCANLYQLQPILMEKYPSGFILPLCVKRHWFDLNKGLTYGEAVVKCSGYGCWPKTLQTNNVKVVSNDPIEILHMILGSTATIDTANSFESLYKFIKSPEFYAPELVECVFTLTKHNMEMRKLMIPAELDGYDSSQCNLPFMIGVNKL